MTERRETAGADSPGVPPGRFSSRRRCASSCAPRPAAPPCSWARRSPPWSGRTSTRPRTTRVWGTRLSIRLGGLGAVAGPARVGQHRADDVLLLRRRPGGAARVRHGRAARAAAARAAAARRHRRDARADRDLPAINAGHSSAHGWGAAMSTDTAFALGMLALVGPRFPDRLRAFLLTVAVVDDLVALVVIAVFYSRHVGAWSRCSSRWRSSRVVLRRARTRRSATASCTRCSASPRGWRCSSPGSTRSSSASAMGLLDVRVPGRARSTCERATELFRLFREQPTAELARTATRRAGLGDLAQRAAAAAVPPVDELRDRAAVRPRQRRHRDQRRVPRPGVHLADHARHPGRLRPRQAARHHRLGLAGHAADPRPAAAAGRLGGRRRRRRDRRHRLHRLAADRHARLRRPASWRRPSSASSARRSSPRP